VDIWVMLPKMCDESRSEVAQVLRKGDAIWSYNALSQDSYSSKWRYFPPINYRLQPGFINYSLGFTGSLYWRADYWSSDPWQDVSRWRISWRGHAGLPGRGGGACQVALHAPQYLRRCGRLRLPRPAEAARPALPGADSRAR
jgi:hypothetical protein